MQPNGKQHVHARKDFRKVRLWVVDYLRESFGHSECPADIGREAAVPDPTVCAGKVACLTEIWDVDHVSYDFLAEVVSVEDEESQRR